MAYNVVMKESGMSKGDRQKERILKESLRILGKKGLEGLSFQKIADRCKVSQSAVLYHYRSKDKLFSALVSFVIAHNHSYIENQMDKADSGRTRLKKYFSFSLKWAREHPDMSRVIVMLYFYASLKKEFSSLYRQIVHGVNERLLEYLLAAQREGQLSLNASLVVIARLLHHNLIGAIINECTAVESARTNLQTEKDWEVFFSKILQEHSLE